MVLEQGSNSCSIYFILSFFLFHFLFFSFVKKKKKEKRRKKEHYHKKKKNQQAVPSLMVQVQNLAYATPKKDMQCRCIGLANTEKKKGTIPNTFWRITKHESTRKKPTCATVATMYYKIINNNMLITQLLQLTLEFCLITHYISCCSELWLVP